MTQETFPSIQVYKVPMPAAVTAGFYAATALMATAVAWSFKSGLTVTALCLIAVMAPLCVLYWFMLVHSPAESYLALSEGELLVAARPFTKITQPLAGVQRAYRGELPELKSTRSMQMFGYVSGIFALPGEKEAVVLARSREIVALETPERNFYLSPKDTEGFIEALSAAGITVS